MNLFSSRKRPAHLGPFPTETLSRNDSMNLDDVPAMQPLTFHDHAHPLRLSNAMADFIAMLDAIRDGACNAKRARIPDDLTERARNIKGAGYFYDAGEVGITAIPDRARLDTPFRNDGIDSLADALRTRQVKALSSGIDQIMATLKEAVTTPLAPVDDHTHAVVFLYEYPREPEPDEPGGDWIAGTNAHRAALRAAETATVLANYFRLLGFKARAHTATTSDVDLNILTVAAGLAKVVNLAGGPQLKHPFIGEHFGVAAVTTTLALATDRPLADVDADGGLAWRLGFGTGRRAKTARPYQHRRFVDGALPFETLKRVDQPTTFFDEAHIPRVPKRTDMFPRAQFGDFGKKVQDATIGGDYLAKNPLGFSPRVALGAFIFLQTGDTAPRVDDSAKDLQTNADNIKAALYFLGVDAVGLSRCPDWVYYSHDAVGDPITPYHKNAISMMVDQGRDSMEGSSGDDWLSGAQSMRAYLRNSILGGVVAAHIRSLGYDARVHSVVDGEVLQPPLSLISGMGEVSRIGEVILHPLLGPRLKTGVVTTNMPFTYDKPIDFGLQKFCAACNKCARECPSGAITAGPKTMFNGYEIWKSDSQRCLQYRLTNTAGSMCGRCMKTCPWNLEGLFAEAPFRWAASHVPRSAPWLAKLDDSLGNGRINPVKKWWWDLELDDEGRYVPAAQTNARELQPELDIQYEDQTLAVYPANLAPPPWPFPFPADREAGIKAYEDMLSPESYRARLSAGHTDGLAHGYTLPDGDAPVLRLLLSKVEPMTAEVTKYEFQSVDGSDLPPFEAGAHLDVVVVPEFFRQYSMSGDPADRSTYQIAVLREDNGRGGSQLLHRLFSEGRRVFVSRPINHFPLNEAATRTWLMAGGIGVTPLIAMAHRLHALGAAFVLHYSCRSRAAAAYLEDLDAAPWRDHVVLHFSDDGSRVDLDGVIDAYQSGWHVYTCGPDRYMQAVLARATDAGWPDDAQHREYFTLPETPEYVNHPFTLKLANDGREIAVSADQSASDALAAAGIAITLKCADGLCGVCQCKVISGDVEHRDFVLSKSQRKDTMILCQSRAREPGGVIEISL